MYLLKRLISKEEFSERKNALSKEKARPEELFADTGQNIDTLLQKAEELFTFIEEAKKKFTEGTLQDRRIILSRLGSNLLVESRKLNIDVAKTLLPIQKLSPIVREIHRRLEPLGTPVDTGVLEEKYRETVSILWNLDSNLGENLTTISKSL